MSEELEAGKESEVAGVDREDYFNVFQNHIFKLIGLYSKNSDNNYAAYHANKAS
jgi:hypothetical protein